MNERTALQNNSLSSFHFKESASFNCIVRLHRMHFEVTQARRLIKYFNTFLLIVEIEPEGPMLPMLFVDDSKNNMLQLCFERDHGSVVRTVAV